MTIKRRGNEGIRVLLETLLGPSSVVIPSSTNFLAAAGLNDE